MEDHDRRQSTLTILSWNVNGFSGKKSSVLEHLRLLKPDMIFLQETHLGPSKDLPPGSIKVQELGHDYLWAVFTVYRANSRGVGVLFRRDLCCEGLRVTGDKKGRYMIVNCQIRGEDFVFVNIYNPGDEKIEFDKDCDFSISPPDSGLLVVAGDFNTVLEADLDKESDSKNKGHRDRARGLMRFLRNFDLMDVWRCLHPEEKNFTYFGAANKGISRLDYFFVPDKTMGRVAACAIHARPQYSDRQDYISDHAPISIQIRTGNKRWQFDSSLLGDESCMAHFSCMLKNFSRKKIKRKRDLWMGLKLRLGCEETAWKRRRKEKKGEEKERRQVLCAGKLTGTESNEIMPVLQSGQLGEYSGPALSVNSETHQLPSPSCNLDLQVYLDKLYKTRKFEELQSINNEERIRGIEMGEGKVVKALTDSDTAVVFLTNPSDAEEVFEDILTDFMTNSGFTVDDTHSEIFSIGFPESSLRSENLKRFKQTSHGFWFQGYFVGSVSGFD
ncbi:uncharacterized protein LOC118784475 [Megalops cyprinoides]|uniref:uncharacterized protein LOC118784475 n=1 Tax=Megalops cyprinoides TaxID=118141 RepID=UPI00186485AF|nr:uncharacterized protein LOC118784475 [Megalops cyprinoides]